MLKDFASIMFVRSEKNDLVVLNSSLNLGHLALSTLLGLLLAFVCLAQLFPFVRGYAGYIRFIELFFVGVFLVQTTRSYRAPVIKPAIAGWLYLFWLGAASVSVTLSGHLGAALIKHAEWLTHCLFALTLWHYLRRDASALKAILWLIPLGFFLTGLFLLSFWFSLNNPHAHDWFIGTPPFGHIRHFGYYALAGLIFSACPLLGPGKAESWPTRGLVLLALSICWGFLFWTGGRAALGSGAVGLALIIGFAGKGRRAWATALLVVAAGIGLWLSTFFWVDNSWVGFTHAVERTTTDTAAKGMNGFLSGRLTIWAGALRPIEGLRWLVGLGPDAYVHLQTKTFGVQPHSMVVQFVLEWGLLGALSFLTLLGFVFRQAYVLLRQEQNPLRRAARITALALMVASTVHSLVDGLYYHAQPLLFLFVCFAIVLLPTTAAPADRAARPSFTFLTTHRTLWVATALLALLFVLNSNTVYALFAR